jgi:hypothetical protein
MAFDPELVAETRGRLTRASHDLRAAEMLAAAAGGPNRTGAVIRSEIIHLPSMFNGSLLRRRQCIVK